MSDTTIIDYGDKKIVVGPGTEWRFTVVNDGDEGPNKAYDTYRQATDAIDRAAANRVKTIRAKLDLRCLTVDGKEMTVSGIHAGNGHLITAPKHDGYGDPYLYPDVSWIRGAIAKSHALRAEAQLVEDAIYPFKIIYSAKHGFHGDMHDGAVKGFADDYAEKHKAAANSDLEKAVQVERAKGKKRHRASL